MKVEALLKRLVVGTIMALVAAELLLVLVSWFLSATMADDVRSLLSSEGIRWFFGNFVSILSTPWLIYLLLLAMAGGCLWQSGISADLSVRAEARNYRQRIALRATLIFFVLYVGIVLLLTTIPHAVLLSATGHLLSSPFSRALVPIVAFGLLTVSVVYGRVSGRFTSIADIVDSFSYGIGRAAPLFILYVFIIQFCESLRFVLAF